MKSMHTAYYPSEQTLADAFMRDIEFGMDLLLRPYIL